eukprot:scaffold28238_cov59-Phaeocystis_antarctica.AAC.1
MHRKRLSTVDGGPARSPMLMWRNGVPFCGGTGGGTRWLDQMAARCSARQRSAACGHGVRGRRGPRATAAVPHRRGRGRAPPRACRCRGACAASVGAQPSGRRAARRSRPGAPPSAKSARARSAAATPPGLPTASPARLPARGCPRGTARPSRWRFDTTHPSHAALIQHNHFGGHGKPHGPQSGCRRAATQEATGCSRPTLPGACAARDGPRSPRWQARAAQHASLAFVTPRRSGLPPQRAWAVARRTHARECRPGRVATGGERAPLQIALRAAGAAGRTAPRQHAIARGSARRAARPGCVEVDSVGSRHNCAGCRQDLARDHDGEEGHEVARRLGRPGQHCVHVSCPRRRLGPLPGVPNGSLLGVKQVVAPKRQHGPRVRVQYHDVLGSCPVVSPHEGPLDRVVARRQPVNQRLLASGRANASGTHRGRILQHVERAVGNTLKSAGHGGAQAVGQHVQPREASHRAEVRLHPLSRQRLVSVLDRRLQHDLGLVPGAGRPQHSLVAAGRASYQQQHLPSGGALLPSAASSAARRGGGTLRAGATSI